MKKVTFREVRWYVFLSSLLCEVRTVTCRVQFDLDQLDFAISTLNFSVSRLKRRSRHLAGSGHPHRREEACGLASGEASSPRSCTNCRVNDGRVAFSQERRCRSHQGRSADRQRVGARRGVRRTGCAPGPASHGRELWNNLSSMSPTGRRYSPAIRPLPSTSPQSLRDVSILATDRL